MTFPDGERVETDSLRHELDDLSVVCTYIRLFRPPLVILTSLTGTSIVDLLIVELSCIHRTFKGLLDQKL